MKFIKMLEAIVLREITKQSEASKEAKAAGMIYQGYSQWVWPDGSVAGYTIDGKLVKTDANGNLPNGMQPPKKGAQKGKQQPAANTPQPAQGAAKGGAQPQAPTAAQEPPASAQAMHLGLIHRGDDEWADETGNIVAKDVDGVLVKTDPTKKGTTQEPDEPDSYTAPEEPEPEIEPEAPVAKHPVERAIMRNGNDIDVLKKTIATKFHKATTPEEKAKWNKAMNDVTSYEKEEKDRLLNKRVSGIEAAEKARKDAFTQRHPELAAKKDTVDPEIARKQAELLAKLDQQEEPSTKLKDMVPPDADWDEPEAEPEPEEYDDGRHPEDDAGRRRDREQLERQWKRDKAEWDADHNY